MRRDWAAVTCLSAMLHPPVPNQNKQVSLLPRSRSGRPLVPFLYQATRNRQGAAKWSSRFRQNVQLRNRAPLPMSLPQALQLPPVHEASPAPAQQMFDRSRTAAVPGQHDRAHPHNASALSPSLEHNHFALPFGASTTPPYRCEKAYLPGPKSNAPNREPASVSVRSPASAAHPVFRENVRLLETRSATS